VRAAVAFAIAAVLVSAPVTTHEARAAGPARSLAETLTGDAKRDNQTGKLLANDGDYAGAALKFQSAYDQSHDARLLWNIAFCEKQLRHYARVLALLRRYEAEGGALLSARDRKEAHELASALQPFTTTVKITASEDGAEIFVDDERIGQSPLEAPYTVDIGTHRIRVTKPGYLESTVTVPVGGGVDLPIALSLKKEVHEGTIAVHAPAGATIAIDDEVVGAGAVERVVPSGGHQLRVQAVGMRPYQSEIVVRDNETRSIDLTLERESDAELPRVQVAVGCVDATPRTAPEGLAVYLDGATVAAPPIEVRTRWDPVRRRDVVAWVSYPATVGIHQAEVRVAGCVPARVTVSVRDARGTSIVGALAPVPETLSEGTAGSTDDWRIGLGTWAGALIQDDLYGDIFGGSTVGVTTRPRDTAVAAVGPVVEGGWVYRWATVLARAGVAWGSTTGSTSGIATPSNVPAFGAVSTAAGLADYRFGLRAGPRLPLRAVALSGGISGAYGIERVTASEWGTSATHSGLRAGFWAAVDGKPWCDWTASVVFEDDLASNMGMRTIGGVALVGFEPNARCRGERTTRYQLEERSP
jgi:hypothetical protein